MSKELEYIQRQIDIVKQQVEGSNIKLIVTNSVTKHQYDYYKNELQTLENIEQALNRLESIDNANPSEALKDLECLKSHISARDMLGETNKKIALDICNDVENALLKAQEKKQYLKWEDLEFGKTTHKLKAKMNGSLYRIEWYIDGMGSKVVCLDKYITNDYLIHSACIKDYNQQFFNDLHLERVEE